MSTKQVLKLASAMIFCIVATGFVSGQPAPPTNIIASDGLFDSKVAVSWSAPPNLYFQVFRSTQNNASTAIPISAWQLPLTFADNTAVTGTTYFYWLKASASSAGTNPSNFSASNDGYRAPIAPNGVSASTGGNGFYDKVKVSWGGVSGHFFRVFRNTVDNPATAIALGTWQTATVFEDFTAVDGVLYFYWVRSSVSSTGSNPSLFSNPSRIGHSGFNRPWNISASDGAYTDFIRVSWNGVWGSSFKVYRNTVDNRSTAVAISGLLSSVSYDDKNVVPGTDYYYWVQASNSIGQNPSPIYENNMGYRAVRPPINPKGSLGTYCDRVRVTWTAAYVPPPANPVTYYRVYRSTTNSSSSAVPLGNGWFTGTMFDDFTATGYSTYYYWIKASAFSNGSKPSDFSARTEGYRARCLEGNEDREVETLPEDYQASTLKVVGNPANGFLALEFNIAYSQNLSFQLFAATGSLVEEAIGFAAEKGRLKESLSVEHLPSGVYFLVGNLDGKTIAQKILVQH